MDGGNCQTLPLLEICQLSSLFVNVFERVVYAFSGCYKITTVFSHAQTVVLCVSCSMVLCQPTGGRARLTEGRYPVCGNRLYVGEASGYQRIVTFLSTCSNAKPSKNLKHIHFFVLIASCQKLLIKVFL